ncbi:MULTISPECIES: type 1 glutamine amidotransferase [Halomonadaceae]|uniref:Type 1 glutamine amidotransferase n=1 Tax=Billgrantia aerodenitrificans TaxID=2733483 RepID=A0ABS9AYY2_9GAMM|nr:MULTISPECIES: type 1 glutamine amidotransferase [Halomonas]MCE8026934.1 type 1 glutamine amidotransferase [Halomonas aerodenitrificans]
MHLHLLQHSPYHGPGRIADWLSSMGHSHTVFHLYDGETPPSLADGDALILLDGPMHVLDDAQHSWLKRERKLIARALDGNKPLLGIGLGARMIAAELGATVGRGTFAEVGWHEVTLAPESPFDLPERFTAFMWHRDVFALPDEALPLGGSSGSPVQGFAWDAGRALGLLCHLEVTRSGVDVLLAKGERPEGSDASPHAQPDEAILADDRRFDRLAPLLDRLLSQWIRSAPA